MALSHLFQQLEIQKKPPQYRFPLLKLPQLVLLECIANLDLFELIIFSVFSKRTKSIAKLIRWNPLDISLGFQAVTDIRSRFPSDQSQQWFIYYNKERKALGHYPYFRSETFGAKVFHQFVLEDDGWGIIDLALLTEHICELFRSPISGIDIADKSLIEWITNFQSTIPYVWIKDDVITSVERLGSVLKNLKVTERLFLGSTIDDQKFKVTKPIPSRFISIKRSFWFKLPAILNGTNSIILLDDPTFTAKDINTILKEWQKGLKLRNLEYLEIKNVLTFWDHELMADLVYTLSSQNDGRPKTVKFHDEWIYKLPEVRCVYHLIRGDGMMGSVLYNYKVFIFQVWRGQV